MRWRNLKIRRPYQEIYIESLRVAGRKRISLNFFEKIRRRSLDRIKRFPLDAQLREGG